MEPRARRINIKRKQFSPVMVGPIVLGWVDNKWKNNSSQFTVLMDGVGYAFNPSVFYYNLLNLIPPRQHSAFGSPVARKALGYRGKPVIIAVPSESLDLNAGDIHDMNLRSMVTLYNSIVRFFEAFYAQTDSYLNSLAPQEVVRETLELTRKGFLEMHLYDWSYRGQPFREILNNSDARFRRVGYTSRSSSFEERVVTAKSMGDFITFLQAQQLPEPVYILKANSPEEMEALEDILPAAPILRLFLGATKRKKKCSIFLASEGDPLIEWIDAETISFNEIAAITQTNEGKS